MEELAVYFAEHPDCGVHEASTGSDENGVPAIVVQDIERRKTDEEGGDVVTRIIISIRAAGRGGRGGAAPTLPIRKTRLLLRGVRRLHGKNWS